MCSEGNVSEFQKLAPLLGNVGDHVVNRCVNPTRVSAAKKSNATCFLQKGLIIWRNRSTGSAARGNLRLCQIMIVSSHTSSVVLVMTEEFSSQGKRQTIAT